METAEVNVTTNSVGRGSCVGLKLSSPPRCYSTINEVMSVVGIKNIYCTWNAVVASSVLQKGK